jgi:hypothetical protein
MFITEDLKKKDKEDLFKDDSLSALIFYMFYYTIWGSSTGNLRWNNPPFKDSLTNLEQNQTRNVGVHIRKEHKILVLVRRFSLLYNTFKRVKKEQTFCPETFAPPVLP